MITIHAQEAIYNVVRSSSVVNFAVHLSVLRSVLTPSRRKITAAEVFFRNMDVEAFADRLYESKPSINSLIVSFLRYQLEDSVEWRYGRHKTIARRGSPFPEEFHY